MRAAIGSIFAAAALLAAVALPVFAQRVISARAGLVNYTEGPVLLNGREAQPARGVFPQMNRQDTLRTSRGRAELLLNPGVFLRVGRDSSIRMLSNELADTRVELLAGTLVLEAAEVRKDTSVALRRGDATVWIRKRGVYRLDSDPAALRVFDGKAVVELGGQRIEAGKGKMVSLGGGALALNKFDRKKPDSLDLWSQSRAGYLASVNLSTARSMLGRSTIRCSGWCLNSLFGVITYIPLRGMYLSPYGYYYTSPHELARPSYSASSQGGGGQAGGGWRGDASSVSPGAGAYSGMGSAGSVTRSAPPASIASPASSSSRPAPPAVERPSTR
jgi:hypothetical protein